MSRQRIFPAIWLIVFLTLACATVQAVAADPRSFDATSFGQRITLGPEWLFRAGDNPAWASPTLDDSGWTTVSTQKELFEYGIRDTSYGWYRVHIHLRPGTQNLMIGLQNTLGSYEIFANGVRIGGSGPFPPTYRYNQFGFAPYPIPDGLLTPQGDLTLAIRFGFNATGSIGRGTSTPIHSGSSLYLLSGESAVREAEFANSQRIVPYLVMAGLSLLIGLIAAALFIALRSQHEYLAAAIYMFAWSAYYVLEAFHYLYPFTFSGGLVLAVFYGLGNAVLIEFVRLVLGLRRTRSILGLQMIYFLAAFSSPFAATPFYSYFLGFFVFYVPMLAVDVVLAVLLLRGGRRGNIEARVLLPALLLITVADYWSFFSYIAFFTHITAARHILPIFHLGSYAFPLLTVGDFFSFVTVLLFLVLRTIGIARERARAAAELEAARTVQQVLIPEDIPTVPGFLLHSVYKPASEVGGDFFQIVAIEDGGVLAVIGDVSGKGMPAAMTVSLLVGTFRSLAHFTQSPSEILVAMNQRMLARSSGGFTTCLVLRADADGTLTVANAGHLAPYSAGKELVLGNGLPLGLSADTTYAETTFRLDPVQQLTLLTDGVVEARSKTGVLFGFDRTAAIAREPAEAIAQAAQDFGQDDDITVVTLARIA